MKITTLLDYIPAIAFFVAYKLYSDIVTATIVILVTTVLASALNFIITKKISKTALVLNIIILALGIPTIILKDPVYIKLKVTIVDLILALILYIGTYILHKNPLAYMLSSVVKLSDLIYKKMAFAWIIYLVLSAILNIIIAFYLTNIFNIPSAKAEALWVDYKAFGNAILNTVFILGHFMYLFKAYPQEFAHLNDEKQLKNKD